jgi:hypothetical protein
VINLDAAIRRNNCSAASLTSTTARPDDPKANPQLTSHVRVLAQYNANARRANEWPLRSILTSLPATRDTFSQIESVPDPSQEWWFIRSLCNDQGCHPVPP